MAYSRESNITNTITSAFPETADIETSSAEYARRFTGQIGEYFLQVQERITLDLLKPWPNATILDVGGGHGQIAIPLVQNGFEVTVLGSDESCKERLDLFLEPDSFHFHCCNMLDLPFAPESFDIVLAFRLLAHVNRWKELLGEMGRVSRDAVIVDYPDVVSFNFFSKQLFRAKKAIEGNTRQFRSFHRSELLDEFARCGFIKSAIHPQFFIPMAVHRAIGSVFISKTIESFSRLLGLSSLFGSPVILRVHRATNSILTN